jgi:hypothetical protein
MRLRPLVFLAGIVAGVTFTAYCGGVAPSSADGPDAGKVCCDCPAAPAPVVKSGTRLKARKLTSPDGASQFLGWWDDELKTPCAWGSDPNARYAGRCAPESWSQDDGSHFADPACTQHVGRVVPSVHDAKYCRASDGRFFGMGASPSKVYGRDTDGACVEAHDAFTQASGATFFACNGEPVTPETFAVIVETRD